VIDKQDHHVFKNQRFACQTVGCHRKSLAVRLILPAVIAACIGVVHPQDLVHEAVRKPELSAGKTSLRDFGVKSQAGQGGFPQPVLVGSSNLRQPVHRDHGGIDAVGIGAKDVGVVAQVFHHSLRGGCHDQEAAVLLAQALVGNPPGADGSHAGGFLHGSIPGKIGCRKITIKESQEARHTFGDIELKNPGAEGKPCLGACGNGEVGDGHQCRGQEQVVRVFHRQTSQRVDSFREGLRSHRLREGGFGCSGFR